MPDPSIEASNSVNVLEALNTTVGKLTTSIRGLVKGQTELKNIAKDTKEAFLNMNQSFKTMTDSFTSEMRRMSQGIQSELKILGSQMEGAMREIGTRSTKSLVTGLDTASPEAKKAGERTGEAYGLGLRQALAKASTTEYEKLAKGWAGMGNTGAAQNVRLNAAGLAAAASSEIPDGMMAQLSRLKNSGATLSGPHAEMLRKYESDLKATVASAKASLKAAQAELALAEAEAFKTRDLRSKSLANFWDSPAGLAAMTGGPSRTDIQSFSKSLRASMTEDAAVAKLNEKAHNDLAKAANKSALALAENGSGLKIWSGHANDAHSAARGLASGFGAMWLTWGNIAPLLAGAAISHTLAGVVKQGAEVNHIMETMRVLTEQTTQETAGLNAQMLEMARSGPIGPKAIAEGMKQLALAGLNASEVSTGIRDVINLSIAGDVEAKKSAEALTGLGTAFGIGVDGYSHIADVLAKTSAASKASVESISDGMKAASVIHKQYGVSLRDAALGISALNNLNIQGTAAGVALRNMYVDLAGRSSASRAELSRIGVDVTDKVTGKFKDLYTIVLNVKEALAGMRIPADAEKSLRAILSERGGKPIIELLSLANQRATDYKVVDGVGQSKYANRLEELQAEMANFEAFAILSSAKLSGTAQNQMKEVASSFQAALVESFSAAEPYLLQTTRDLKEMFQGENFKNGAASLVSGVSTLVSLMLKLSDVIAIVAGGFIAWKAAQITTWLFAKAADAVTLATMKTAASVAELGLAYEVTAVAAQMSASKQVAASLSVTAQVAAQSKVQTAANTAQSLTAVGAAANGLSGFMTKAGGAVAGLLGFFSKLNPYLFLAYSAWEMYALFKDKAFDPAKDATALNSLKDYHEKLGKELEALNNINTARALGISLQELENNKQKEKQTSDTKSTLAALDSQIAAKREAINFWNSKITNSQQKLDPTKDATLRDLEARKKSITDTQSMVAAREDDIKLASLIKRLADEATQAAKIIPEGVRGDLSGPIQGTASTLATRETDRIGMLEQQLDRELSTLQNSNAKKLAAIDDLHKNHLINDATFYVRKNVQEEAAFDSELSAINSRETEVVGAIVAAQRRALSALGAKGAAGMNADQVQDRANDFLGMRDSEFNASHPKALDRTVAKQHLSDLAAEAKALADIDTKTDEMRSKLVDGHSLKLSQANNALAGSYRNIGIELEKLDRSMLGHHTQIMGQQADSLITSPFEKPWEKAERDQRKASMKKYADDIARIQDEINAKESQSLAQFNEAKTSGDLKVYLRVAEERSLTIAALQREQAKLNASAGLSGVYAGQEGAAAGRTSRSNEITKFTGEFATGLSSAVSTAIFEGGEKGGQQLKKYLEDMFIRQPFEIILKTSMAELMGAKAGAEGMGGIMDWARGGMGKLFGGVKSNTTVDEFGSIVDAKDSGGIMSWLQGLMGNSAPKEAANMTAASSLLSAGGILAAAGTALTSAAAMMGAGSASGGAGSFAAMFSGNSAGGGWSPTLAEFLPSAGGVPAFAAGGQMNPFSLARVNENGTEMLSMGGQDYLMTGSQGAAITPAHRMPSAGGGIQHSVTIQIDSRTDQAQVHALVMGAVQQGNMQLVDQLHQSGALAR